MASMKDAEMHIASLFGTVLLTAALSGPMIYFGFADRVDEAPPLKETEVIEATIAYRKTPKKQPEKKVETQAVEKPEGVSRDENKKVEPKKDDEKKAQKPDENPFGKFTRPSEDEGKPTTNPDGDFNGSEKGFAPESKGDPFFGRLRGDMNFTFPEIAKGQSIPIGCIHLQPDGKIKTFSFDPPIGKPGEDDIQIAAEAALKELQKVRAQTPEPVPTHLLSITSKWLCFRFSKPAG